MECPICGEELCCYDSFGYFAGYGSGEKCGDIYRCDNENWMDICRQKYKIVLKPHNNVLLQAISTSIVGLGQIYCLSDKFLETAIKEIGEQELIEYIKGC